MIPLFIDHVRACSYEYQRVQCINCIYNMHSFSRLILNAFIHTDISR